MIKGKKREQLTKEVILKKISEFDIYKAFSPKFKLGKKFSSPMPGRGDSDPSFIISTKYGNYFHCDYGDSRYYGNAFDFVMQLNTCDYTTALRFIDTHFGLGIQAPLKDWKSVVNSYEQPKIKENEQEIHIECHYRRFNAEANKYWNAYHLSEDYLKKHNVFQVKQLFIARQRLILPWNEIVFAYLTEDGHKKIYRPTISRKSKKNGDWRFKSNIPFTQMFLPDNLENCQRILILKSRKDELVSSLINDCVGSVQAESIACFSEENLKILKDKEVYLGFGNDSQGEKESNLICESFGWNKIFTPKDTNSEINDFAEYGKLYGLEKLESVINNKLI